MTRPTFTIYIYICLLRLFLLPRLLLCVAMSCKPHLAESRTFPHGRMPSSVGAPSFRSGAGAQELQALHAYRPHVLRRARDEGVRPWRPPPAPGFRNSSMVRPRKEHDIWRRAAIHLRAVAPPAVSATAARARRLGNQTPEPHSGCKIHRAFGRCCVNVLCVLDPVESTTAPMWKALAITDIAIGRDRVAKGVGRWW